MQFRHLEEIGLDEAENVINNDKFNSYLNNSDSFYATQVNKLERDFASFDITREIITSVARDIRNFSDVEEFLLGVVFSNEFDMEVSYLAHKQLFDMKFKENSYKNTLAYINLSAKSFSVPLKTVVSASIALGDMKLLEPFLMQYDESDLDTNIVRFKADVVKRDITDIFADMHGVPEYKLNQQGYRGDSPMSSAHFYEHEITRALDRD